MIACLVSCLLTKNRNKRGHRREILPNLPLPPPLHPPAHASTYQRPSHGPSVTNALDSPHRSRNHSRSLKSLAQRKVLHFRMSHLRHEMTTLSFHEFARRNAEKGLVGGMDYIHVNPGIVKTGVMRYLPWYMRAISHVGYAVLTPWRTDVEESGERCLEMGFAGRYGGKDGDENLEKVEGVNGCQGAYTVFKTGESTGTKDAVKIMTREGAGNVVWDNTLDQFEKVKTQGKV